MWGKWKVWTGQGNGKSDKKLEMIMYEMKWFQMVYHQSDRQYMDDYTLKIERKWKGKWVERTEEMKIWKPARCFLKGLSDRNVNEIIRNENFVQKHKRISQRYLLGTTKQQRVTVWRAPSPLSSSESKNGLKSDFVTRLYVGRMERTAKTRDEIELVKAAECGDFGTLTSLLQKGVCPNVQRVWYWKWGG